VEHGDFYGGKHFRTPAMTPLERSLASAYFLAKKKRWLVMAISFNLDLYYWEWEIQGVRKLRLRWQHSSVSGLGTR